MQYALLDLGNVCDRAAGKLYDRPVDSDGLADIATTLLLVNYELRKWMRAARVERAKTRQLQASEMAMAAIDRHLVRLGNVQAPPSDDAMRRVVDRALHLVVRIVSVLQAEVAARPAAP